MAERLAAAGVWEQYLGCTRETWRGGWPTAQLAELGRTRHLCTIFGPVGSGKTHLATAILAEWLRGGGRGIWREVSTALEEIKRGMGGGGAERLVDELRSSGQLVVLDDLLTQQGTDWGDFFVSSVIRFRHGRNLPTVVTANVGDLLDLDRIEPRLSSRCAGGVVIGLAGVDGRTVRRGG